MRVLVTGATGFVGRHLVSGLLDAGHDVVALTRRPEAYDAPEGVTVRAGDLLDPATLDGMAEGVGAAYYLVHSMGSGADFEERDRRAARNFVDAAADSGVERVLYLGGLGVEGDDLSPHLASRREVERVLEAGDPALTTLRAAVVVGPGSASFRMVEQLASRLPVMITPRWVRTPCQPIAISDAVTYLVGLLDHPETTGETYEIGGPEVLSYQEMLVRTAELMGRRIYVLPVPVLSPRLSAYWVDLVTDVPRSVAHPLIEGVRNPVTVSDPRIHQVIEQDLTPFEDAARRALEAAPP
ncbi:MAG: NAD(P)H-binding protein [Halobacteriaceae archaeon]